MKADKPTLPTIELTSPQQEYLDAVKHHLARANELQLLVIRMRRDCNHIWVPTGDYEWSERLGIWIIDCDSRCAVCEEYGGRYCPTSPNLQCDEDSMYSVECKYCGRTG